MIVERLEARRFFSATVSEGYTGFYEINGDDSDDVIAVSVSMTDQTFTLDGTTYSGVAFIFVNGGDGDDQISVTSVDGSGMIGASISGGNGRDAISLNFDGGVWGGRGADEIHLSDSFRGECYGEEGNDRMFISGGCYGAEIRGGEGHDLIDCSANFYGVVVFGGEGHDTILGTEQDDQIYGQEGHDSMSGGGGDDTFYARDGDADDIDGGAGYDFLYANNEEGVIVGVEEIYL